MNYWIFRGNREDFDIDTYIENFKYIYWAVKHPKHQAEITIGDKVFIWRSKGQSKDPYGLIAFGKIVEKPVDKDNVKHPEFLLEKYWLKREVSPIKVGIKLETVRLTLDNGLIESSLLERDPVLASMQLLTARQGTNFKLTEHQFKKIYNLWLGLPSDSELLDDSDDYETDEGNIALRIHKIRERDKKLIKIAKDNYIKKHKALFCEACGFNFKKLYGFDYAEAHHIKPLSKIKAGEKVTVNDLAILCANCHRAVHRIKDSDPWMKFLKLHKKL